MASLLVQLEDTKQKWKSCMRDTCPKQHTNYLKKMADPAVKKAHAKCTQKNCVAEFDETLAFYKKHALALEKVYTDLIDTNMVKLKETKDNAMKRVLRVMIEEDKLSLRALKKIIKVKSLEEYYQKVSKVYLGI